MSDFFITLELVYEQIKKLSDAENEIELFVDEVLIDDNGLAGISKQKELLEKMEILMREYKWLIDENITMIEDYTREITGIDDAISSFFAGLKNISDH